jgi:aminocarboxymuconate-semialdehyde decarboxylase
MSNRNRREFIRDVSTATAGVIVAGSGLMAGCARRERAGRQVMVGGRRIRTIDVHTHCYVLEVLPLVQDQWWATQVRAAAENDRGVRITPDVIGPERVQFMDEHGIDVQALSINAYWYAAERDLATRLIAVQNEALAAACAKFPGRFVGFATVALQHPDLAAQQLEDAMTKYNMPGASLSGNIAGEELSSPRFDPFWAKVQELGAFIFIHPQGESGGFEEGRSYPAGVLKRFEGASAIHHPLETTVALSHLIFDGTLDKFPGLRICGAHGGGFLPAYIGRSDATCERPGTKCIPLKKKPSEYFKEQLFCDSLTFNTPELLLRVEQFGAGQVVLGTDHPAPWPTKGVDDVLDAAGLSDEQKIAILGGNLSKLLRIEA